MLLCSDITIFWCSNSDALSPRHPTSHKNFFQGKSMFLTSLVWSCSSLGSSTPSKPQSVSSLHQANRRTVKYKSWAVMAWRLRLVRATQEERSRTRRLLLRIPARERTVLSCKRERCYLIYSCLALTYIPRTWGGGSVKRKLTTLHPIYFC